MVPIYSPSLQMSSVALTSRYCLQALGRETVAMHHSETKGGSPRGPFIASTAGKFMACRYGKPKSSPWTFESRGRAISQW